MYWPKEESVSVVARSRLLEGSVLLASRYIMATSKELVNFYVQLMSLTSFSLLF